MAIYRIQPVYKEYLWGGKRLKTDYGKDTNTPTLSESWELSTHPDGTSYLSSDTGELISLKEFIEKHKDSLGKNYQKFSDFPVLIKLIDAGDTLSVQVHPDEDYAQKYENDHGKTEMWVVMDTQKDSFIYYGLKNPKSQKELLQSIKEGTLINHLNKVPIKKGDVYFVPPGTIHAIGKGALVAEIQQNSNVTYRIYDYNRLDTDGNPRELHLEKALEVADLKPVTDNFEFGDYLGFSEAFLVGSFEVKGKVKEKIVDQTSFIYYLIMSGNGILWTDTQNLELRQGDSVFVEAGTGPVHFDGFMKVLEVSLPSEEFLQKHRKEDN